MKQSYPEENINSLFLDEENTQTITGLNLVVGIGASAGGLESLQELFTALATHLNHAYIIVQHLSPDFKSLMSELLARKTTMQIMTATNNLLIKPNTVYLAPPRGFLEVSNGHLIVVDAKDPKEFSLPIDVFFNSLASNVGDKAIAIVLSGTGTDGSRGVRAIQSEGGRVFVQDPDTAKFDGMPLAAIATDAVDAVLTPKDMASFLASPHKSFIVTEQSIEDSSLAHLCQILKRECGIDFSEYKSATIIRRVQRRMAIREIETLDEYAQLLIEDPLELQKVCNSLLIGVTWFFRDPGAYTDLSDKAITDILEKSDTNETIRVWSLGCSTGQEAYSIAILFFEAMEATGIHRDLRIFATDADDAAIAKASAGSYPKTIVEDMPPDRLARFFVEHEDHYLVTSRLRRSILFARHNIMVDPPFSNMNLVTCRNMLIYFLGSAQRRVLSLITFALKKNGFLFLGPSESLGHHAQYYAEVIESSRVYQKMQNALPPAAQAWEARTKPRDAPQKTTREFVPKTNHLIKTQAGELAQSLSMHAHIAQHLLGIWMPPSIIIDSIGRVLYVYGDASSFANKLAGGRFSNHYRALLRDPLTQAVSSALDRVTKGKKRIIFRDIVLNARPPATKMMQAAPEPEETHELKQETVDLRIEFLRLGDEQDPFFILTFLNYRIEDVAQEQRIQDEGHDEQFGSNSHALKRIKQLEDDLNKSEANLQITVEELETTNEELQSSNEELTSANEELQSTNEELHSLNEELYTVNSEYQEKIGELSTLNDDYNNILNATGSAIVLLDKAMIIRKYTPEVTRYFSIMHNDIGRPLYHFSHRLDLANLSHIIAKVFETKQAVHKQVRVLEFSPLFDPIEVREQYRTDFVNLEANPYIDSNGKVGGSVLVLSRIPQIMENIDVELIPEPSL